MPAGEYDGCPQTGQVSGLVPVSSGTGFLALIIRYFLGSAFRRRRTVQEAYLPIRSTFCPCLGIRTITSNVEFSMASVEKGSLIER